MYMAALLLLRVHLVTFRHTDMDLFFFFFFFFGGGGGGVTVGMGNPSLCFTYFRIVNLYKLKELVV